MSHELNIAQCHAKMCFREARERYYHTSHTNVSVYIKEEDLQMTTHSS